MRSASHAGRVSVGTALALLLALGSTGCSPTGSDAAAPEAVVDAELEQAVITAHQSLMRAYEEQSIDQFVLLKGSAARPGESMHRPGANGPR